MSRIFRSLGSHFRVDRSHGTAETSPAVDTFTSTVEALQEAAPPMPAATSLSVSRRRLLSSLASQFGGQALPKRYPGLPAAAAAALTLLLVGSLGAGAAAGGTPMSEVLGVLGLGATPGDTHGTAVSSAVHDAIASSTPGAGRGEAVSLAACLAAHDRSTLPPGAQAAPGQQEKEPKVCATETTEGEEAEEPVEDTAGEPVIEASSTPTHGQTVRDAVHAAQASSTPGAGRGAAVSEAACTAAHDRTTLPPGAQNAPGNQEKEPKDCTHPSATETPEADASEVEDDDASPGKGKGGGNGNAGGNGNGGANGNGDGNRNQP